MNYLFIDGDYMTLILALTLIIILAILALSLADAIERLGDWLRDQVVDWLDD